MKTTIDMAREAGFIIDESLGVPYALINEKTFVEFNVALERLVELARADERNRTWTQEHWTDYERSIATQEREACAKVCDVFYCDYCADAIRNRKQA
jgi:hypothetical protein